MKIGDEIYVHGFIDEIRKDTVIIRNKGGYYGTAKEEIVDSLETKELDMLLQKLEPIKRAKVNDLPDAPDKNTIYTLGQEWIYLNNNWVRLC